MSKVIVLTATVGANVATNGTIDFPYVTGITQATYIPGSEVLAVEALQDVIDQDNAKFTVASDADSLTVTWKGATTIPAGSVVKLQARVAGGEVTVVEQANQVDSVAADVATLKTDFNALLAKLRAAGILVS